jgi:hypothetical protein
MKTYSLEGKNITVKEPITFLLAIKLAYKYGIFGDSQREIHIKRENNSIAFTSPDVYCCAAIVRIVRDYITEYSEEECERP